jgi:hypothetical protein
MADTTTTTTTQQPDIQLPTTAIVENLQLVPKKELDELKKEFRFQKNIQNWTSGFIVAILVVCFISFVTFIIDAWKFHGTTTKEYQTTIQELRDNNLDLKIETIRNKLDSLDKKTDNLESVIKTPHKNFHKK